MKQLYFIFLFSIATSLCLAQGSITTPGTGGAVAINFDGSTPGILNGAFSGLQISATPAVGDLNMNGVYIRDNISGSTEDASILFGAGGTVATNAVMQGSSTGSVTSSGVYSFDIGGGNRALGFQPSGARWNDFPSDEGHIIFKFTNNSGSTLNNFSVSFDMYEFNDNSRSSILEAYLTDDIGTPTFGAPLFSQATTSAAAAVPAWSNIASPSFSANVTVANGASVYLRILVYEGPGGSGSRDELAIDNITIYGTFNTPAPVELTTFSAIAKTNYVQLDWQTVQEINNANFELQHSTNGINFYPIHNQKGQLNSNYEINYSFNDYNAINGINYYRLKQTDIDEKYSFSNIIEADFTNDKTFEPSIYPNPVYYGELFVDIESAFDNVSTIRIVNIAGQEVMHSKQKVVRGLNHLSISTSALAKGNYILLYNDNSTTYTKHFSISK